MNDSVRAKIDKFEATRLPDEGIAYPDATRQVTELRAQRDRLRECLRDFMALLDQGVLVRNTEHDADYGKFFNQATRIAAVLKAAQIALESDSIDHARQAKTE